MTNRAPLRVLVALPPALHAEFVPQLLDRGHDVLSAPPRAALESTLTDAPVDALLASPACGLDGSVLGLCDRRGIRVTALVDSDADRRAALALGLADVLDRRTSYSRMEGLLRGEVLTAAPEPQQSGGEIIAVWGPAGSPGRSTIAVHLAAEFARAGSTVLVVDADPYGGTVAQRLGLLDEVPTFAAAARLTDSDSLTRLEFERLAQRYESRSARFWVLTGLTRPDRWPELTGARVQNALRRCARWVDVIVVDTGFNLESDEEIVSDVQGPRRNASTLAAIGAADQVVVVGSADPVGIARLLRGCAELAEAVDLRRRHVVVNGVRQSVAGAGAASQILATLKRFGGIREATLLPDDRNALDSALLEGTLLHDSVPRSPLIPALRRLTALISAGFETGLVSTAAGRAAGARRRRLRPARRDPGRRTEKASNGRS